MSNAVRPRGDRQPATRSRAPQAGSCPPAAPFSYKDVDAVVETVERAGLAGRVARLVPLGVVKG